MLKKIFLSTSLVLIYLTIVLTNALAMEIAFEDDFNLPNASLLNSSQWVISPSDSFKINAGSTWNFAQGIVNSSGPNSYAEINDFNEKDVVIDFDLNRFVASDDLFYLVMRETGNSNTRIMFSSNGPSNNNISVAVMEIGSNSNRWNIGTTSYGLGQYDWVSFRVRLNDSKVQIFCKRTSENEYIKLGEVTGSKYISSNSGSLRLYIHSQPGSTNILNIDNIKVKQAIKDKKVYADYHGYRYTRENDGQLGNWKTALKSSSTSVEEPYSIANYNADIIDSNGNNQLAAHGNPLVGIQSYNDTHYLEYQVLTAKMAGIDGFFFEYANPNNGLTDSDLIKLQKVAQKYNFEIGIDWLDAQYYDWITNNVDYVAWCTANGKTNTDVAAKTQYIQVVYQKLIDWVYDKPNALKINGKPLMLQFNGNNNVFNGATLSTIKNYTYNYNGQSNVSSPFLFLRRAPMGLANSNDPNVQKFWSDPNGWELYSDGTFGWKPLTERAVPAPYLGQYDNYGDERDSAEFAGAHIEGILKTTNHKINMAGIIPGFDNKFCSAWGAWGIELLDRKDGLTYEKGWQQYLKNSDVVDAVLIATWSDHTEGSGIEPLTSYNYREVVTTAKYAAEFKGFSDKSSTLDFTIPEKLFKLRKKIKLMESSGFPQSVIDNNTLILDNVATDISLGGYDTALQMLNSVEQNLNALQSSNLKQTNYSFNFFSTEQDVSTGHKHINIDNTAAEIIRNKYFEGEIQFDYYDNSTYSANNILYLTSFPTPQSTNKPLENRARLMEYRFGNGNGQWKTAKVKLDKVNLRLDSHVLPSPNTLIDMYFSGWGKIRNVTVDFTTYEYETTDLTSSLTVDVPTIVEGSYQITVSNAQPNEQITFMVSPSNTLATDSNIIYLDQKLSSAEGTATFNFKPKFEVNGSYAIGFGNAANSLSNKLLYIYIAEKEYIFARPIFLNGANIVKYTYVRNNLNYSFMPKLVVTFYNGNRLIDVLVQELDTSVAQVGAEQVSNIDLMLPMNTTTIKAFVFNDINGIVPLSDVGIYR